MSDEVHRLDRLHIQASFADMDQAYALRPRLDALGQRLVPRLLERLFDAQAPSGMTLQIDRLDLDLGVLRPDHLEEDALKALEEALSEALTRSIHTARNGPSPHARLMSKAEHRLMQFEAYLATGVAPYARGGEAFDASSRLRELADQQPAALVAMLKQRARDRYVLERLALQAGEGGLRHLLSVLAPGDAAIILALMADALLAFREVPIAPVQYAAEPELRRIFWIVTLEFLLHDAGSQFNRRSYLAFLLEREAARLRIALPLLLRLLAAAVQRASERSQLRSSLQGALAELLEGFGRADQPAAPTAWQDRAGTGECGAAALSGDVESLSALAGSLAAADFGQLVHDMAPGDAAMVLAVVERVVAGASVGALEPEGGSELAGFVRAWALDWLARAADAPINAQAFERDLQAAIKARFPAEDDEVSGPFGRDEALALVEHFLRTGHPPGGGGELPEIARRDGPRLAALARRLAREKPNAALELADRLLGWLLPDELLEALAPNAEQLLSAGHAPWRELVGSLLRDEPPQHPAGASFGPALDRRALVGAWLDAAAGAKRTPRAKGAAAGPELDEALHLLPDSSLAELICLFLADDEEATAARLWRSLQALDDDRREALLVNLAPWATNPAGLLAATLAPLDAARRLEVLSRAAAASLAGGKVDLAGLARPLDLAAPPTGRRRASRPQKASAAQRPGVQQLLAWLDGAAAAPAEAALLGRYFAELADAGDPALTAYLNANRGRRSVRARWVKRLPETALGRLAHVLAPAGAQALLDSVQVISAAWRQVAPFGMRRPAPDQIWDLLLEHMAERGRVDLPAVVDAMMRRVTDGDAGLLDRLKTRSSQLAQAGGHAPLVAAMRRPPKSSASAAPRQPPSPRAKSGEREPKKPRGPEPGQTLYVLNAGLVLFNPFLPMLFERLGLLTPTEAGKPRIVGVEAASRAAHLLQYLVDGRLDRPEPDLVLNKLLSGQSISQPIEKSIAAEPSDLQHCDGLLDAVIGNWPALRNSSHAALRETFLQREGRLQRGDGKWTLQVQRKTLDVLVDQVPWGFAVVYHPWMDDPVHVTW